MRKIGLVCLFGILMAGCIGSGEVTKFPPKDYPRLTEELRTLSGYILGPQAKPTAGQLTVLSELESDAAERTRELTTIIDGAIATLNRMLGDQPKVMVTRPGGGR